MRFLVIGNLENRRVEFFQRACERLSLPAPCVLSWEGFLSDERSLDRALGSCDILRIESPGENARVESILVQQGGGRPFSEEDYISGRIGNQRAWYAGWTSALSRVKEVSGGDIPFMNAPDDIALMFDKYRCQNSLKAGGVPVSPILGLAGSAGEVFRLMDEERVKRVFVKPSHGSSASGVVALQRSGDRVLATTSVRQMNGKLYNSLQISRYETRQEVDSLFDSLAAENLFVEKWFPKMTVGRRIVDFRVLVIAGRVRHVVARASRSPITNLHLGNSRGDLDLIKNQLGGDTWSKAVRVCEKAALCFPDSLYVAVDLMIGASNESVAVAEVNAFGDLLPQLFSEGEDSYEAELREMCLHS